MSRRTMAEGGVLQTLKVHLLLCSLLLLSQPPIFVGASGSQRNPLGAILRLRGGVGAPADVGARGYENAPPFPLQYGLEQPVTAEKQKLREMVVPDTHSTLPQAVAALQSEHEVKIRRGKTPPSAFARAMRCRALIQHVCCGQETSDGTACSIWRSQRTSHPTSSESKARGCSGPIPPLIALRLLCYAPATPCPVLT